MSVLETATYRTAPTLVENIFPECYIPARLLLIILIGRKYCSVFGTVTCIYFILLQPQESYYLWRSPLFGVALTLFFFFILRRIEKIKKYRFSSPHFHVFLYASWVDLTQLLPQPNASWRCLRTYLGSLLSYYASPLPASRFPPSCGVFNHQRPRDTHIRL